MENDRSKRAEKFFAGKGFYIVLALCIAVIGISAVSIALNSDGGDAGRVGNPMDIAHMVLYLCSDRAGFITGENICIDGGMTRQMIYHGDNGWTLTE